MNYFLILILLFFQLFACEQMEIWDKNTEKIDDEPPYLSSVASISNTKVQIMFIEEVDETTSEEPQNYSIPGLDVVSAVRDDNDFSIVVVTTNSQLNLTYEATVTEVLDEFLNEIDSPYTFEFTGDALPEVVSVVSTDNTHVRVTFSENMDDFLADDEQYYSIADTATGMVQLNATGALIVSNTVVELTTDSQPDNQSYTLTVSALEDVTENAIDSWDTIASPDTTKRQSVFIGDPLPCVVSVSDLTDYVLEITFSEDVAGTNVVANYSIVETLNVTSTLNVISVNVISETVARITTGNQSDLVDYTVRVSNVQDLTPNGIDPVNNFGSFIGDARPSVLSATWSKPNIVNVTFSEDIDLTTAETIANYDIVDTATGLVLLGVAAANRILADVVEITTDNQSDIGYTITVSNVEDVQGNTVDPSNNTSSFTGNARPKFVSASRNGSSDLLLTFSEDMSDDAAINNKDNYILRDTDTHADISVLINNVYIDAVSKNLVHITLTTTLPNGNYELEISAIAQDVDGNLLLLPNIRSFSVD